MKKYTREEVFKNTLEYFDGDELATKVWIDKYALKDREGNIYELTPKDMHKRLSKEFSRIETNYKNPLSEEEIFHLFDKFKYLVPAGSPMFGIGNEFSLSSLSNCFVVGNNNESDSYGSIMRTDEEIAQIYKRRGGCGLSLDHYRPTGALANGSKLKDDAGSTLYMERFSNTTKEVAQCIEENQRVLTKRGLISIKNINDKDLVWTKKGWIKVLKVLNNGKKNLVEVTSKNGYKITCSKDHLFLTRKDGEVKEMPIGKLKVGDNIVLLNGVDVDKDLVKLKKSEFKKTVYKVTNQYGHVDERAANRYIENLIFPTKLTKDLAYVLGFSFGDGCVEKSKTKASRKLVVACGHKDPDIQDKIVKLTKEIFNYECNIKKGDGAVNSVTVGNSEIVTFLEDNGLLKQKSKDIKIPLKIWESNSEIQMSFYSGLFDADGYASGRKKGYSYSSISEKMTSGIRTLLLSNGILAKTHVERDRGENWEDIYSTTVVGAVNQKFLIDKSVESIKIQRKGFISALDKYKSPYSAKDLNISSKEYSYIPSSGCMSINCLKRCEKYEYEILTLNEIVNIREVEKGNTYDLSLEFEHLFWCEGFYVHNSGRRGALMETISINHPDSEKFIDKKVDTSKVTGANISVKINDDFMEAILNDSDFIQTFPINVTLPITSDFLVKNKYRYNELYFADDIYLKKIKAKKLWDKIIHNAWKSAEPGILFWDTIINESPAGVYGKDWKELSTNPCAELPLCPYDSCRLLAINLYSYIEKPFTQAAKFNFNLFKKHVGLAQRIMDNLVDLEIEKLDQIINKIKLDKEPENIKFVELDLWEKIKNKAVGGRRTGLGITAEGDMLAALGLRYGIKEATDFTVEVHKTLAVESYKSSIQLAKERGSFPIWDYKKEKENPFLNRVFLEVEKEKTWIDIEADYFRYGRRNIANLTIAPTGTTSLMTQTTSGIEPVFLPFYKRRRKVNDKSKAVFTDEMGDMWEENKVFHHKFVDWFTINVDKFINESHLKEFGWKGVYSSKKYLSSLSNQELEEIVKFSPYYKATSSDVDYIGKVEMQGKIQKWIDHSISVTVNIPEDVTEQIVSDVYKKAYEVGCKGITVYREGSRSGVLISDSKKEIQESEGIIYNKAPKRLKTLNCDIYSISRGGQAFTIIVGLLKGKPYEIFALEKLSNCEFPDRIKKGTLTKVKSKTYELKGGINEKEYRINNIIDHLSNEERKDTRKFSSMLRHGMHPKYMIEQINEYASISSFDKVIAKALSNYLAGEKIKTKDVCPSCGGELRNEGGCNICPDCGWSACS